jgi:hypothetical protein
VATPSLAQEHPQHPHPAKPADCCRSPRPTAAPTSHRATLSGCRTAEGKSGVSEVSRVLAGRAQGSKSDTTHQVTASWLLLRTVSACCCGEDTKGGSWVC